MIIISKQISEKFLFLNELDTWDENVLFFESSIQYAKFVLLILNNISDIKVFVLKLNRFNEIKGAMKKHRIQICNIFCIKIVYI